MFDIALTMCDTLESLAEAIARLVPEPAERLDSSGAVRLVDAFERIGRLAAAGRLAALQAVARTRAWQGEGHALLHTGSPNGPAPHWDTPSEPLRRHTPLPSGPKHDGRLRRVRCRSRKYRRSRSRRRPIRARKRRCSRPQRPNPRLSSGSNAGWFESQPPGTTPISESGEPGSFAFVRKTTARFESMAGSCPKMPRH